MKKAISLLLALVMCLSLCACGKEKEEPSASYIEEVENTVDMTETEQKSVETEPVIVETEPKLEIVELTLDNWQEYFEFVDNPNFQKDAFGEVEGFTVGISLQLKEEYQQRSASIENGAIEYQMQYAVIGCELNKEAETYKLSDIHLVSENVYTRKNTLSVSLGIGGGEYFEEAPSSQPAIDTIAATYGASGPYAKSVHGYPINVEIIRIQGTLTFNN